MMLLLSVPPLCLICGREMGDSAIGDHACGTCLRKEPFYNSARGVAHYQEAVANLLHRLKYQGEYSVLPALKEIIMMWHPIASQEEDRILPVPLHIKRLRHRGFNQTLLLARLFFPDSNNHHTDGCLTKNPPYLLILRLGSTELSGGEI